MAKVSFDLREDLLMQLDELCSKINKSRSQYLAEITNVSLSGNMTKLYKGNILQEDEFKNLQIDLYKATDNFFPEIFAFKGKGLIIYVNLINNKDKSICVGTEMDKEYEKLKLQLLIKLEDGKLLFIEIEVDLCVQAGKVTITTSDKSNIIIFNDLNDLGNEINKNNTNLLYLDKDKDIRQINSISRCYYKNQEADIKFKLELTDIYKLKCNTKYSNE